ncbi:MAG: hypothetical protein M3370_10345 [Actinomycetota bacterium]|nr:hypothetical protein [Actinomycetota bacterium]
MEGESFDDLDEEAGRRPTGEEPEPLTVGDTAELHLLRSPSEELDLLAALIEKRLAAGAEPGDLAVLVDVRRKGDEVTRALGRAGVPTHPLGTATTAPTPRECWWGRSSARRASSSRRSTSRAGRRGVALTVVRSPRPAVRATGGAGGTAAQDAVRGVDACQRPIDPPGQR